MKRSTINQIIREGDEFIRSFGYIMPPFAYWTPGQMKDRADDMKGLINAGWAGI